MKFLGIIIISLMISLASCAPTRNTTTVARNKPRVVVVKKNQPNRVVVVNPRRNNRPNRVVIVR